MIKNIEWLKEEIWKQDIVMNKGYIYTDDLMSIINEVNEPEVLSQEWVRAHEQQVHPDHPSNAWWVPSDDLQDLFVPKQEVVDRAYKDGYEKGKEHATKVTKPTIPQFVAEWIEEIHERNTMIELDHLNDSLSSQNMKKEHKLYFWIKENFDTFAEACIAYPNVEVEKEQKYLLKHNGEYLKSVEVHTYHDRESLDELDIHLSYTAKERAQIFTKEQKEYIEKHLNVEVEELEE